MKHLTAKAFIAKRDRLDSAELLMRGEVRRLMPRIGARYGLDGEALRLALETAERNPAPALACLKAIERSL